MHHKAVVFWDMALCGLVDQF